MVASWWPRGGARKRDKLFIHQTKGRIIPKLFNWHGISGIWLGALALLFAITGIGLSQCDWLGPTVAQVDEPASWDARFKQDCVDTVSLRQAADQVLAAFPGRVISGAQIAKEKRTSISSPNADPTIGMSGLAMLTRKFTHSAKTKCGRQLLANKMRRQSLEA